LAQAYSPRNGAVFCTLDASMCIYSDKLSLYSGELTADCDSSLKS